MAKERKIFLALVPHRDIRLVLRKYSDTLFKAGFAGAYHFPWVSPLAALSRPFNTEELKNCAVKIRENAGSKITAHEGAAIVFPAGESTLLFGPRLDFALGGSENAKITSIFSPPVIGTCLLSAGEDASLPPVPKLSFRAAAVANMFWHPLRSDGSIIGYRWKIGKLIWLGHSYTEEASHGGARGTGVGVGS